MSSKTCTFFLQGLCRYGDSCFYTHALPESFETQEDVDAMNEELRLSQDLECNICYDNILQKQERFGLLSGCTHAFCLSCVRNWRGTADQPKQTVRQCPVCRVETHFIIPSSRMVTDPARKKALTDTYRVRPPTSRLVPLALTHAVGYFFAEKPGFDSVPSLQRRKVRERARFSLE